VAKGKLHEISFFLTFLSNLLKITRFQLVLWYLGSASR